MEIDRKTSLCLAGLTAGAAAWYLHTRERRAYSFEDRVVVLSGGSRGLGLAMARRLVAEGARLALLARSEEELERAERDLRQRGGEVRGYACDVADKSAVEETIARVAEDFDGIDVLINNAGIIVSSAFENQPDEDFEAAIGIHLRGPLYTMRAVLPHLRRRGGGRILNISSIGGKVGVPHMSAYSASKYGLVGFSHALAAELRREGIFVTVACPGLMRTGSHRHALFRGQRSKEYGWFTALDTNPLLSTSARRAARHLIEACRQGRAEIVYPWRWRVAAAGAQLFPGLAVEANALVHRLLPEPRARTNEAVAGEEADDGSLPRGYVRPVEAAAGDLNQK